MVKKFLKREGNNWFLDEGTKGPAGPPGPVGATGATGATGANGASNPLDTVKYVDVNSIITPTDGSIVAPFITIQEAIDDSLGTATIYVAPGNYSSEDLTVNSINLSIIGMQANGHPSDSRPVNNIGTITVTGNFCYLENIRCVSVTSNDAVYLNNCAVSGDVVMAGEPIWFQSTVSGIVNCLVANIRECVVNDLTGTNVELIDTTIGTAMSVDSFIATNCQFSNSATINFANDSRLIDCRLNTNTFTGGGSNRLDVDAETYRYFITGSASGDCLIQITTRPGTNFLSTAGSGSTTDEILAVGHDAGMYQISINTVCTTPGEFSALTQFYSFHNAFLTGTQSCDVVLNASLENSETIANSVLTVLSDGTEAITLTTIITGGGGVVWATSIIPLG